MMTSGQATGEQTSSTCFDCGLMTSRRTVGEAHCMCGRLHAAPRKSELISIPRSTAVGCLGGSDNVFKSEEVQRHNKANDCWLTAHGCVYDATDFISMHPGGRCILTQAGKDATRAFDFHSRAGRLVWKKFKIGHLEVDGVRSVMGRIAESIYHQLICNICNSS
eukprot:TRINITY_DN40334_c0_g1_i1.p1 TRINITY_DN40334_c0_g1~~TRINITY_DN40334_c0_g1_i1.p1  ORF type:complete len:164 (-),score=17.51 TRINITY_DN40334_c0_g1_i1:553-1044(-)